MATNRKIACTGDESGIYIVIGKAHLSLVLLSMLACMRIGYAQMAEPGQQLFAAKCAACHQLNGLGIEGAFPPLAGSRLVNGDPDAMIRLVLKGRGGMPAFRGTSDDQTLAETISYVRTGWTNTSSRVTPEMIAKIRKEMGTMDVSDHGH